MAKIAAKVPEAAHVLIDFKPQHAFFVGIDSDGCAFDAMELKHKECFTPTIVKVWGLQAVSKYRARDVRVRQPLFQDPRPEPLDRAGQGLRPAAGAPRGQSAQGEGAQGRQNQGVHRTRATR